MSARVVSSELHFQQGKVSEHDHVLGWLRMNRSKFEIADGIEYRKYECLAQPRHPFFSPRDPETCHRLHEGWCWTMRGVPRVLFYEWNGATEPASKERNVSDEGNTQL